MDQEIGIDANVQWNKQIFTQDVYINYMIILDIEDAESSAPQKIGINAVAIIVSVPEGTFGTLYGNFLLCSILIIYCSIF